LEEAVSVSKGEGGAEQNPPSSLKAAVIEDRESMWRRRRRDGSVGVCMVFWF
jgi:hypothetical protein